jgi:hypothetical protein
VAKHLPLRISGIHQESSMDREGKVRAGFTLLRMRVLQNERMGIAPPLIQGVPHGWDGELSIK